jgi:hypothetical protein
MKKLLTKHFRLAASVIPNQSSDKRKLARKQQAMDSADKPDLLYSAGSAPNKKEYQNR